MLEQEFANLQVGQSVVQTASGVRFTIIERIERQHHHPLFRAASQTDQSFKLTLTKPAAFELVREADPVVFEARFSMQPRVGRSIPLTDNEAGQMIAVSEANGSFSINLFGTAPAQSLLEALASERVKITIEVIKD